MFRSRTLSMSRNKRRKKRLSRKIRNNRRLLLQQRKDNIKIISINNKSEENKDEHNQNTRSVIGYTIID